MSFRTPLKYINVMKPIATFKFPPQVFPKPNIQGITGTIGLTGIKGTPGLTGIQGVPGPGSVVLSMQTNPVVVEGTTGKLHSYVIPANTLYNINDYIKVTIWDTIINNTGVSGGSGIWSFQMNTITQLSLETAIDSNNSFWMTIYIIKTAANAQTLLLQGSSYAGVVYSIFRDTTDISLQTFANATSDSITFENSVTEYAMIITKGG